MTDMQHELAKAIEAAIWPLTDWDGDPLNAASAAGVAAAVALTIVERRIGELTEALLAANGMLRWYRREVPVEYQPVAGAMEETLRKVSASLEQSQHPQ
jgi:hypothetical protein